MFKDKKILICDFPSKYDFPPTGYGAIERWLWNVAFNSHRLGLEVTVSGPQWKEELTKFANIEKRRINDISPLEFLKHNTQFDFLVGGHEYWQDDDLRERFERLSLHSLTYQLMPSPVPEKKIFDNIRHTLFVYSDEMKNRFSLQQPIKCPYLATGFNEEPQIQSPKGYAVWIGRLDREKLPHIAILAAKKLRIPIYLLGKTERDPEYYNQIKSHLNSSGVMRITSKGCLEGEVTGEDKMGIIGGASLAFYTCDKDYIEAAGGIFGEYLLSGIPIAAMSWRKGTSAHTAIGPNNEGGRIFEANKNMDDDYISEGLAKVGSECLHIKREVILEWSIPQYDPLTLTSNLLLYASHKQKALKIDTF